MRSLSATLLCFSIVGLCACSEDDSPTSGAGGTSVSAAGTGGADAGVNDSAGSGGGGASGASNLDTPQGDVSLAGAGAIEDNGGGAEDGGTGATGSDSGAPQVAFACPAGPFPASPLPAGAVTPQPLCTGMTFTEGAVWFAERNTLFFSDFQIGDAASNFTGRIRTFTPGGQCQDFIQGAGTNGLTIAPDGNLLGARHQDQTLTIFDLETQEASVLVADNGGLAFNAPNDMVVRSDGNIYFTDADYMLGNRVSEQPTRAYRRDPSGALTVIDDGLNPNGIMLSPDQTRLYLGHLGGGANGNNVVVYDVDAAGALSNRQPFANVGSDGMAMDCAGNLYVTQGGVRVYSPEGDLLGTINAPGAANVAFGGPERRTLFITATASLLSVDLLIPGLPY
jgi:gluconolactonase